MFYRPMFFPATFFTPSTIRFAWLAVILMTIAVALMSAFSVVTAIPIFHFVPITAFMLSVMVIHVLINRFCFQVIAIRKTYQITNLNYCCRDFTGCTHVLLTCLKDDGACVAYFPFHCYVIVFCVYGQCNSLGGPNSLHHSILNSVYTSNEASIDYNSISFVHLISTSSWKMSDCFLLCNFKLTLWICSQKKVAFSSQDNFLFKHWEYRHFCQSTQKIYKLEVYKLPRGIDRVKA